jgi:F-box protein 42
MLLILDTDLQSVLYFADVAKTKQRNLHKAIVDFDIRWDTLTPVDMAPTISKRYSHTAVIHENSMYVFGGCTCSMTTFNDLWKLDLSKRQWVRPVAMGTYPSPKACSSLVCYKDLLGKRVLKMFL